MKEKFFFIIKNLGLYNCLFLIFIFIFLSVLEILGIGLIIPIISLLFDITNSGFIENSIEKYNLNFFTSKNYITLTLLLFVLVYFIKTLLYIYSVNKKNRIAFDLQKKISNSIYSYFMNLSYIEFINRNSSLAVKIITQTAASATTAFILPIIVITSEIFIILFIGALLIFVDWYSTIIIMIIFFLGVYLISRKAKKNNYKWGVSAEISHTERVRLLVESLRSFKEINIYNKLNFFRNNFNDKNNQNITAVEKHTSWLEYPRTLLEFLIIFCSVIFLLIAIKSNISTEEILIKMGVFVLAGLRLLPSSTRITNAINSIRFGSHSFDTIYGFLKNKKELTNKQNIKKYQLRDSIKFKNVSFHYNKDKKENGVRNLNFEIKKNKITAIYGKSGSGKSTIINLMLGFFEANNGDILVDNIKLKKIRNEFRNNIGYVPQETFLLDQSLRENIAFGEDKKKISHKNLKKCLIQAEIYNHIQKLPKKLSTITGENGVKISGGEKQRIGIARALYKSPEILIFDEPTSSLDKTTEDKILKTIKKLKKSKTIIIISHSKKIKQIADKIIEI